MAVLRLAIAMVLGIGLPLLVQLIDRRRMDQAMRDRTWNVATWGAALYAFGPLSLLGWYWVTRPRGRRVWLGGLLTGATLATLELVDSIVCLAANVGAPNAADTGLAFLGGALGGGVLLGAFELVGLVRRRQ